MTTSRNEALVAAYRVTRWTVQIGAGEVTLRIGRPADWRVPVPSAVITAYNPGSGDGVRRPRPSENRAAQAELERRLAEMGIARLEALAHGTGPNASDWDEPGVLAIGIGREDAIALAGDFGQNAIVWIGEDRTPALVVTRAGFAGELPGTLLPTPPFNDRP